MEIILLILLAIVVVLFLILFKLLRFIFRLLDFTFNPWKSKCKFPDNISENDFEDIVNNASRSERISLYSDGPIVYGEVTSQSGASTWEFQLSFNDHRRITGRYYVYTENDDSNIPSLIGDTIKSEIKSLRWNLF